MTARKRRIGGQEPHPTTGRGRLRRLGLGLLLTVAACGTGTLWRSAEAPLDPPTYTPSHIASSARLRTIMRELERMRVDRLPQEINSKAFIERRLDVLADAGDTLAAAAVAIAGEAGAVGLDASDQRRFVSSAGALNHRALVLRSRALEGDLPRAVAAYADLKETCDTCHALFRRR